MKREILVAGGVAAVGLGIGVAAGLVSRRRRIQGPDVPESTPPNAKEKRESSNNLPPSVPEPRPFRGTPFAEGVSAPVWPVQTSHSRGAVLSYRDDTGTFHGNWARRFGAPRSDGSRFHVGVDLFAFDGDPVVAVADGTVVALQSFHLGSWAILVDHGPFVMLYGEVTKGSWSEFGLAKGSRVSAGDPIARVACMVRSGGECTSHMLHIESYAPGTVRNARWYSSGDRPSNILDPSRVLLRAKVAVS